MMGRRRPGPTGLQTLTAAIQVANAVQERDAETIRRERARLRDALRTVPQHALPVRVGDGTAYLGDRPLTEPYVRLSDVLRLLEP